MRVVASLTTMPDRYEKIIKTLKSINSQSYPISAIYLGIPYKSRRLKIEYPPIPNEISKLCTVVRCDDFGPITKILGGLLSEQDENTVIITFDDDMIYPKNMVEKLIHYHELYPNSALGSSGMLLKYNCPMCAITPNENNFLFRIPKFSVPLEGRRVDSIYGYPGALYVRKFFPDLQLLESKFLNYALINHDMLMNDDIVISGYLSLHNIERKILPNMPVVSFVLDERGTRVRTTNEISYDLDMFFNRMNAAIKTAKSIGMYSITEPLDMSETVVGISFIIILVVLILIAIIIFLLYNESELTINMLMI